MRGENLQSRWWEGKLALLQGKRISHIDVGTGNMRVVWQTSGSNAANRRTQQCPMEKRTGSSSLSVSQYPWPQHVGYSTIQYPPYPRGGTVCGLSLGSGDGLGPRMDTLNTKFGLHCMGPTGIGWEPLDS